MKKALLSLALCCFLVVSISFVSRSFAAQTDKPAVSEHEAHSDEVAEKSFKAEMSVPDGIKQEEPFKIRIFIKDDKGKTVPDFDMFQEKLMHLVLVSNDLGFFSHLHPEHQGNGCFLTDATLPSAGNYTLFSDYRPAGKKEQLSVLKLDIKGNGKPSDVMDTGETEKILDNMKVSVNFLPETVKANEDATITFYLKQVMDNSPVKGLQPYLGEKRHLVIIKKSPVLTSKDYIHAHAMKGGAESKIEFMTGFCLPSQISYPLK